MTATATDKNVAVAERIRRHGIRISEQQAETLRRAELTLQRWSEQECGDGNDFCSWAIERHEITGEPYRCTYYHDGKTRKERIPDRERGALERVRKVCRDLGLVFYHQTDPRGCALYVATPEMVGDGKLDCVYSSRMIGCCA